MWMSTPSWFDAKTVSQFKIKARFRVFENTVIFELDLEKAVLSHIIILSLVLESIQFLN